MEQEKLILDACCGARMMWFNKAHPMAEVDPLFGHKSGKASNTHWLCFMKLPAAAPAKKYPQHLDKNLPTGLT